MSNRSCTTCPAPSTCTLTVLVGRNPEMGTVPGNGTLVFLRFCADCEQVEKQDLLLSATDNAEFVCSIPDAIGSEV